MSWRYPDRDAFDVSSLKIRAMISLYLPTAPNACVYYLQSMAGEGGPCRCRGCTRRKPEFSTARRSIRVSDDDC